MQNIYFTLGRRQGAFCCVCVWLLLVGISLRAQPVLVKDVFPVRNQPVSSVKLALYGKLYFAATTASTGTELWQSDLDGTNMTLVKDIVTGKGSSNPTQLTLGSNTLYFVANGGLYRSDGTGPGTTLVKSFAVAPTGLISINGIAYFAAGEAATGVELWKSNGTAAGTVLVKDINPGTASSSPGSLANMNGTVMFAATHTTSGRELWKSNGTAAGTTLVADIFPGTSTDDEYPGPNSSDPGELTYLNNRVYFAATNADYGRELWSSGGSSYNTQLEADLFYVSAPEPILSSAPHRFTVVNNSLYFVATVSGNPVERIFRIAEPWDGPEEVGGASPIRYYAPAYVTDVLAIGGTLYYGTYTYTPSAGAGIGLSSIVGSSDQPIKSFSQGEESIGEFANVDGTLYFSASDGKSGVEVWRSDGTPEGTTVLPELSPGSGSATPTNLFGIGKTLYFTSTYGTGFPALWKYDLTTPPATAIRINAGGSAYQVYEFDEETYDTYPGDYFGEDAYFAGGNTGSTTVDAGNVYDPGLYHTYRWGTFSYNIPVPAGNYSVVLHFAEPYWGSKAPGGAGSRKFNVDAEGSRKLTEYDIFVNGGGAMQAVKATFTVKVTDGTLNLNFLKGTADNPVVSALEILPIGITNHAPVLAEIPNQSLSAGQTLTVTASATDADGDALTYSLVNPPAGATIHPTTGVLTWTHNQGGSVEIMVKVTDDGDPAFSDTKILRICAGPRIDLPVLGSTYCNVAPGTTNFMGQVTVKNSEPDITYQVWGGRGTYQAFSEPQVGNGGDLVFTFQIAAQVNAPDTYTFNVQAYVCESGTLTQAAQVVLVPALAAPTAAGKTISSGQTATLTASSSQPGVTTYRWYAAATGGSPLFTGASFTTPVLTGTTTYYVAAVASGCESPRKAVTVTVNPAGGATAFRVNAGGNAFSTADARNFGADGYFSGGAVSTTTAKDIAGTADDYLYQTGRHGASFSYNFPTGNGSYDVVLHFAETYFGNTAPGGVGSRKFHVNLEGVRKLTDYDIFARAGGALRVAQETFRVTVGDGTLNVAFLKGSADNPAVKAIEVLPAGAALAINSGGNGFTVAAGKRFSPDVYYANGGVSNIPGGEILNTTDDALYYNARFGPNFSYGIPSGNGTFDVILHFAETYWGYRAAGGAGSRKFDVYVEGTKRLSGYDVFAKAGGSMRAVKETLRVTVSDGVLNLYFAKGTADNPFVSAVEVVPVTAVARMAAGEPDGEDWQVRLYPNPVRDKLSVGLPFAASQVKATTITDAAGTVHLVNAHEVAAEDRLQLSVGTLPRGFFLLRLDTDRGYRVVKFTKQ
jgi:ELWxxDGT repeat protein